MLKVIKMPSNFCRGFFRAWIGISVIWVFLVLVFASAMVPQPHSAPQPEPQACKSAVTKFECTMAILSQPASTEAVPPSRDEWIKFFGFFAGLAAAVPGLLFAVGVWIGWVARGFRSI